MICCFLFFALAALSAGVASSPLTVLVTYPASQIPSDHSLCLMGSSMGLSWATPSPPLQTLKKDTFSLTLSGSSDGALQVKAVLVSGDGQIIWMNGANQICPLTGTCNVLPWFFTGQGTIEYATKSLYSPQLNNTRPVIMYLPPSYYENPYKRDYEVLIMHDGQNLFDPNTAFMHNAWMAQNGLDGDIYSGQMREIIVAGVWNTDDRNDEYTYSFDKSEGFGGKGDLYLDFLEATVVPFVQEMYPRARAVTGGLGILGSSLGGLISCYALWTRPHVYSKAGCMSSSFWWNNEDFRNVIIPTRGPPPRSVQFYLDSGDQPAPDGDDKNQTMAVRDLMMTAKYGFKMNSTIFYYLDVGADHSETYWGPRFHIPMADLYPGAK